VVADLSGHSMRVGAAQDLMADGVGILPIMQASGWKSMNVIGRYVKHAEIGLLARLRKFWAKEAAIAGVPAVASEACLSETSVCGRQTKTGSVGISGDP
jgi:hypothetical protein